MKIKDLVTLEPQVEVEKTQKNVPIIQTQLLVFKSQELPTEKWSSCPEETILHTRYVSTHVL